MKKRPYNKHTIPAISVALFAIFASLIIVLAFAATSSVAFESEAATGVSEGTVSIISGDAAASNNTYLEFNEATPPPAAPPSPDGCYVTVFGSLYNLNKLADVNIGVVNLLDKTVRRTHTKTSLKCGTLASPTDATSVYQSKHYNRFGCWPDLAPYYAGNGDAPTDKTPICKGA